MGSLKYGEEIALELESETPATRKCLERVPPELSDWKPHERSMPMGYLTLLVAEIPSWISSMIRNGEIDLATFEHFKPKTAAELVARFDNNVQEAVRLLKELPDEALSKPFSLKNDGQLLFSSPLKDNLGSSVNHMVHHRGQLTVYLRLNDIAVPSIYGPSADDRTF